MAEPALQQQPAPAQHPGQQVLPPPQRDDNREVDFDALLGELPSRPDCSHVLTMPFWSPQGDRGGSADICPGCAGLEGPLIGLFENATMIVLLAALMLFAAFWLPFTIGRCYTGLCHNLEMSTPSAGEYRSLDEPNILCSAVVG